MDALYILTCGIVWRKTADPEAGWGLVAGLESTDPELRLVAHTLLVERGEEAMGLLESAVRMGAVSPQAAAPCMTEILRVAHDKQGTGRPARAYWTDGVAC